MTTAQDGSGTTDSPTEPDAGGTKRSAAERIRTLLTEQRYAVLCTQSQEQPYGSLVTHAASEDLKSVVFSTPITTRKYRLLRECAHVALLIDSRSSSSADVMEIEAVTITGHAHEVEPGAEFEHWAGLLAARHPHLEGFIKAESSALFRVEVVRCLHVHRFQEVQQWVPGHDS
jgi:nitroimidazol reductase NimA-like FMN-containing flavoprotein (pyridoxamine 5'-phosphate oxidase superfamily)